MSGPADRCVDLVAVTDTVDEPGGKRFVGEQRCAVGESRDLVDREATRLGNRLGDLLPRRLGQPVESLAMGVGEAGGDDAVRSALVLVPLTELRLDAELVERSAQEGD